MSKTLVNNVIFVIDRSGSMSNHSRSVEQVVRGLKDPLAQADQITRVSLYTFDDRVERNLHLRHPDALSEFRFQARGQTALLDAINQAIDEHKSLLSGSDEDHSFLLYVITDGQENASRNVTAATLRAKIAGLSESWTVAALVPDVTGIHYAKNAGIPAGNIEIWNTRSTTGFEEVGRRLVDTYNNYTSMRSTGVTKSTSLFVDTKNLTTAVVKQNLIEDNSFRSYAVNSLVAQPIKEYTEQMTGRPYSVGSVYYELTKPETIQGSKAIAIANKVDGKVYSGVAARSVLGLPAVETKVRPGDFGDWRIYVQSKSVNRNLIPNQTFLVKN